MRSPRASDTDTGTHNLNRGTGTDTDTGTNTDTNTDNDPDTHRPPRGQDYPPTTILRILKILTNLKILTSCVYAFLDEWVASGGTPNLENQDCEDLPILQRVRERRNVNSVEIIFVAALVTLMV